MGMGIAKTLWTRLIVLFLFILTILMPGSVAHAQDEFQVVNYPAETTTDSQKLECVYSLIEQMRLEHNRQVGIAQSNPEKYINSGVFKTYADLSKAKLKKLLAERNELMEKIRLARYTKKEWSRLLEGELDEAYLELYGDKAQLKTLSTKATSSRA